MNRKANSFSCWQPIEIEYSIPLLMNQGIRQLLRDGEIYPKSQISDLQNGLSIATDSVPRLPASKQLQGLFSVNQLSPFGLFHSGSTPISFHHPIATMIQMLYRCNLDVI